MKLLLIATATAALMLSPTLAVAHGSSGGSTGHSGTMGPSSMSSTSTSTTTQRGPSSTGQPNQSCQATGSQTPGNAASAPGSAFNTSGQAGTVYAGQQSQNSGNTASVSQYDVACTH
jgi:hypothetical protein